MNTHFSKRNIINLIAVVATLLGARAYCQERVSEEMFAALKYAEENGYQVSNSVIIASKLADGDLPRVLENIDPKVRQRLGDLLVDKLYIAVSIVDESGEVEKQIVLFIELETNMLLAQYRSR